MQDTLKKWMTDHDYTSLSDFRGKMSQEAASNPAVFERVQFMKYFR
jgi:dihydroorotate dehydrogenase (fumarate)